VCEVSPTSNLNSYSLTTPFFYTLPLALFKQVVWTPGLIHLLPSSPLSSRFIRYNKKTSKDTTRDHTCGCAVNAPHCKSYPEHVERSSEVVQEVKERDTHAKQEVRQVAKRCLESGQLGDVIIVEIFGRRARTSNDGPFKIVTEDQTRGAHVMDQSYRVGWSSHELF